LSSVYLEPTTEPRKLWDEVCIDVLAGQCLITEPRCSKGNGEETDQEGVVLQFCYGFEGACLI
jgi:hypothetical protein